MAIVVNEDVVRGITISDPYVPYTGNGDITVYVEVALDGHVDVHEYHDFPSSIDIFLSIGEVEELVSILQAKIAMAEGLEVKSNG